MKKLLENKKRLWVIAGAFALLIGAVAVWYFFIYNNSVVATVGGKKITRDELSSETENAQKIAEYNGAEAGDSEETAKQTLIERALMDIAAVDFGITVTDEEVSIDLAASSANYNNNMEELEAAYLYAYGLDGDELDTVVYYKLLKEKLENKILADRSGKLLYARFNQANSVEELIGIETDDLEAWARTKTESWYSKLVAGKSFAELYSSIQSEGKYPAYYADNFILNENSDMTDSEKTAIRNTATGSYSEVIKNDTYYAIYYVEEAGDGNYDTWSSFIDDYSKQYVKYSLLTYKQTATIRDVVYKAVALVMPNAANAACSACSNCVGTTVTGYVKDGATSLPIASATVTGTSSSSAFCEGSSSSSVTGWCGYSSGSATSSSTGLYSIPRWDGYSCRFNCAGGTLTVVGSATGYFTRTYDNGGSGYTIVNGSTFNISLLLYVNQPPTVVPVSPLGTLSSPYKYNIVTNNTIYLNAKADDPENYKVQYRLAYKKSTDGGTSWGSWVYVPSYSTYTAFYTDNTAFTVKSYLPSALGTGLYYWAVMAADEQGITSNYSGNPYNHAMAQYFKIGYGVTYNGNGNTGGTVPTDSNVYITNENVIVKANTGSLVKAGYTFGGWNTAANGSGTTYAAGSDLPMGSANVTLYAVWTASPLSCAVTPQAGLSPLVVSVSVTGGASPYDYDMDYKINDVVQAIVYEYVDRSTPVYYTYQTGASYQIRVQDANGTIATCTPNAVAVTDPTDSSGGEVSP